MRRSIAKAQIKARKRKDKKHEAEMKEAALARNKALKEAKQAADKATALEAKRKAEEKKLSAEARLRSARGKSKKKKARGFIAETKGSFKKLQKTLGS